MSVRGRQTHRYYLEIPFKTFFENLDLRGFVVRSTIWPMKSDLDKLQFISKKISKLIIV